MFKVKIFTVGKVKDNWLTDALDEYSKRLKPHMSIEWHLAKTDEQLSAWLDKENAFICLDPKGSSFSSEGFSKWLHKQDSRISFAIGGAEGFTEEIKAKALLKISLSAMTFTHQFARLILLEQLYRAVEIDKGSPYHK